MNMFKKTGGFTLVELIVVIAILAILAGVAIPAYSGYIGKAQEAADQQVISAINSSIQAATAVNAAEVTAATLTDTNQVDLTWGGTGAGQAALDYEMYMSGNDTTLNRLNKVEVVEGLVVGTYVK